MTINIRNPEADSLARELAAIDRTTITDAIITALRETIKTRLARESPTETARRIIAKHGLVLNPDRTPLPQDAYHELDHDLTGDA